MNERASGQVDLVKTVLIAGIAQRIRDRHETQRQAARSLKLHEGVISRLCNGEVERFSLTFLIDLAHALGASISVEVR
jgi:predicted XRE-type DNA-binding protein